MKRTLINNFKLNKEVGLTSTSSMLMDFVFVAIVSLLFNGLIINKNKSDVDQLVFMTLAAVLFAVHYFSDAVFRQRYSKRTITFRIIMVLKMLALGGIAVGIDILVFRKNKATENHDFLKHSGHYIFLIGLMLRRVISIFQYVMVSIANTDRAIRKINRIKAITRLASLLLATVQIVLMASSVDLNTIIYVFYPIHIILGLITNFLFINSGIKSESVKIKNNTSYYKDRYSRLNFLFISSFIVSGAIQFAWYYQEPGDEYMFLRVFFTFLIGAMVFWSYVDRFHRFEIKESSKTVVVLNLINLILVTSLLWLGGMTINANSKANMKFIVIVSSAALSIYLATLASFSKLISKNHCKGGLARSYKYWFVASSIPFVLLFATMAIVYNYIPIDGNLHYVIHYSLVIPSLILINISSRLIIGLAKKNNKLQCEI